MIEYDELWNYIRSLKMTNKLTKKPKGFHEKNLAHIYKPDRNI